MDSRIPFLKYAMTGQDVPMGSTAKRGDGIPVPDWHEGQVVFTPRLEEAVRFNIFNADAGLQALSAWPIGHGGGHCVKIVRCKTSWRGDLRVCITGEAEVSPYPCEGIYDSRMNHVVLHDQAGIMESTLIHELEHARHCNLMLMILGSCHEIHVRQREYLSMLAVTIYGDEFPMLDIPTRKWPVLLRDSWNYPHVLASFNFLLRLPLSLSMRAFELAGSLDEIQRTGDISPVHDKLLRKIRDCAQSEYERVYEGTFGVRRAELAGIIYELPMI
ncbi:hypothetical protein L0Y65_07165 [Candidatus Micrarchaeota archaeon]|nr:hypothetical protein [Candidatus Micrarchaeota archaeon]